MSKAPQVTPAAPPAPAAASSESWVLVRNPGPGLRRLDTFELFDMPPSRERVRGMKLPRLIAAGGQVSLSPADAARAIDAGLERVRLAS